MGFRSSGSQLDLPRFLPLPILLLALCLVLGAVSGSAQPMRAEVVDGPSEGGTGTPCEDGIVRDDGSAETAYGWVPSVVDGRYAQEFRRDEVGSDNIATFCVCWRRTRMDTDIDFEVHFYRHERVVDPDDGAVTWVPELEPYAIVPASATNITDDVAGTWVEVDVGAVELPLGPFFSIGVKWDPSVEDFFFVCDDTSDTTPRSNAWFIDDSAEGWTSVLNTIDPIFFVHRAIMMRAVPGPPLPAAIEIPAMDLRGVVIFALVLAGLGGLVLRRR